MAVWNLVLLAALAEIPAAEVETLQGRKQSGQLLEMTDSVVRLKTADAPVEVPLADVLSVRLLDRPEPEPSAGARVALADGTRLTCSEFTVQKGQAKLAAGPAGAFTLPIARVAHVRFGISTAKLDEAWESLVARDSRTDLVVVKKEDVLDHLDGVVGDVGEKIGFLLDGEDVPIAREKVYGIIYRRKAANTSRAACQIDLAGGDALQASKVEWNGSAFKVRLSAGPELTLSPTVVAAFDYSAGKVRYLSQLEPREVKYVPFFDLVYEYRRDRSLDGTPISIGGKSYPRGLAIHSKTTLRYRIGGEFSRFQATAGIDDTVRRLQRLVKLTISGDGKPLFEGDISGKDPPRPLDLDVSGVRDLEIVVDFGSDGGESGDHLDLGDAKLLK